MGLEGPGFKSYSTTFQLQDLGRFLSSLSLIW